MSRASLLVFVAACKLGGSLGGSSSTAAPSNTRTNEVSNDRAERRKFVSTKESAAKLNGLPGMTCADSDRSTVEGACWDPPGSTRAAPMAHLQPGMRVLQAPEWTDLAPRAVYWFDMPREAKLGNDGVPMIPDVRTNPPIAYTPYAAQGFARPPLPSMQGKSIQDVIAAFDALDFPFSLVVDYVECEGAHDTVCSVATIDDRDSHIRLKVSQRIKYRGTDREQRWVPDKLEGRPTADVVADLKKLGFTNVVVVEADLPCERGIVCSTYRPGWHPTKQAIELQVRRAKK